jgi:hypothetical protein
MSDDDIPAVVTQVHQLVQWVGNGRSLTATGELRVADGLELVCLLGTGDHPRGGPDLRRLSSSRNLPNLQALLRLTVEAGLLRIQRGRLVQVRKHAQQAATPEGVRQLLVQNLHQTASTLLSSDPAPPESGHAALDALWTTLSEQTGTPVSVRELTDTLWGMIAASVDPADVYPGTTPREMKAEFAEMVDIVLSDYAELQLLVIHPESTRVELTPLGRREACTRSRYVSPSPRKAISEAIDSGPDYRVIADCDVAVLRTLAEDGPSRVVTFNAR